MKKNPGLYKRIKNETAYLGIRTVIGLFRMLPRKAALRISSMLGRVAPFLARKDYSRAVENLTTAFGNDRDEHEIRKLARETFRHLAMNFTDAARLAVMSPEQIKNICVPHNMDRLKENLAKGRGVIGLTSHTGCWELLGVYLATVGIPIAVIARRMHDTRLEKMLVETRIRGGMKNISRGHNTRDVIRALKDGYLLGVLIDQDTNIKGEFVDFFGKSAHTATAPALLSLKYDVPIIPVLTYRDKSNRHHVCIGEPVEINATGDRDNDVLELTAQCSKTIERFVNEHHEQWVWFHRRWKTKKKIPKVESKTS